MNFGDLSLDEPCIEGIDWSGGIGPALNVTRAVFRNVSLSNCHIRSTRLQDVRLEKCDLSNAVLRGMEAVRVEFVDCRLIGMRAIECRWSSVLVENCDVRYGQLNDGRIQISEFRGSNLSECDLRGTVFEHTVFGLTVLNRADLTGAKLSGTDLSGAEIEGVTLRAEDVRGLIVTAAQALQLAPLLGISIK